MGVKNESVERTKTKGMLTDIEHIAGKEETSLLIASTSSNVSGYSKNKPLKKQVHSGHSTSVLNLCPCKITFFMWPDG